MWRSTSGSLFCRGSFRHGFVSRNTLDYFFGLRFYKPFRETEGLVFNTWERWGPDQPRLGMPPFRLYRLVNRGSSPTTESCCRYVSRPAMNDYLFGLRKSAPLLWEFVLHSGLAHRQDCTIQIHVARGRQSAENPYVHP